MLLRRIFPPRVRCVKLVEYQGGKISFGVEIGGGVFSLSNFTFEKKKLQNASEMVQVLDNRQYLMCNDYRHLQPGTPEFKEYQRRRDVILDGITAFQNTIIAHRDNSAGRSDTLDSAVRKMQEVLNLESLSEAAAKTDEVQYVQAKASLGQSLHAPHSSTLLDFYEDLALQLEVSQRLFENQCKVRDDLYELLESDGRFVLQGLEYEEAFRKFHNAMNAEEKRKFDFIREMTDDMAKNNQATLSMLENNKYALRDGNDLIDLQEHLQFWLAKYRSLKDDADVCLIYTGAIESKPFPITVRDFVRRKILEKNGNNKNNETPRERQTNYSTGSIDPSRRRND